MKKITFLLMIVYCCYFQPTFAQPEFVGSDEYGRIFDLTYDANVENRVYALTLSNHILQSDDNGETWSILYSHPGKIHGLKLMLNSNALTFYSDRSTYANYGIFIYDLETHTVTREFNLPVQNADREWITSYCIFEENTDIALVLQEFKIGLTSYAKVQYTENGGTDWNEVYYNMDNDTIFPSKVAINPNDGQKLYITLNYGFGDHNGGLLYSNDGGQSWEDMIPGIVLDPITFNPANPDEMYVGTGWNYGDFPENLYHSTDGGENWEIVPITWTNYSANCIKYIRFNPGNPSDIIVLEENEVAISADGGESWQNHVFENAADSVYNYYYGSKASYNPFNANELFVSGPYYPLFSSDKGVTYSWVKTPFGFASDKVEIYKNDNEKHLFYGIDRGYVHKNLTTGEEKGYGTLLPDIYLNYNPPVFQIDKNVLGRVFTFEANMEDYGLYVSDDYGETKSQIMTTYNLIFQCLATSASVANTVWVVTEDTGGEKEFIKIDYNDLNNIIVQPLTAPGQGDIVGMYIDPENTEHIILATQLGIYHTMDGGINWENITTGLAEIGMIYCITQNPLNPQQYTIGCFAGIFTSIDGGYTWTQMSKHWAHYVQHSSEVDGHIVAVVYPSSESKNLILYSTDSGNTWTTIDTEALEGTIAYYSCADFQEESVDVYLNSIDLGLGKYTIGFSNPQPWEYTVTDQSHTIRVPNYIAPTILGDTLKPGDWIGVFYTGNDGNEQCGGAVQINEDGAADVIAYGDDPDTPDIKEGFATDEEFVWRLFDQSEAQEYDGMAQYDIFMPNQGNFAIGGLSRLISLEAIGTGIGAIDTEKTVDIYPNPANDAISIDLSNNGSENATLSLLDATGQTVLVTSFTGKLKLDVSNYIPGIYFAQIKSNTISETRKIIIN